ncbi:Rpp14/Pop5 family protein [Amylocarpus encephaloides]|uniref:Ribonuclease P/MRP protein subunit POP5 n=1 Tax=Amylocarpus encephaloides TaxID=45428 RepID=A0A9P8C429_9HELO|nr:Rpp14/Pop5 family protein [Amylocarpus encephaloides]
MVRIKNRYLLVNILYPELDDATQKGTPDVLAINQSTTDALKIKDLTGGIRGQVRQLFGDYGSGAISDNLQVKYLSPATSTFILRVSRVHYQVVWAALTFMTSVPVKNGKKCVFRVVRVSGTIRKAEEEAIRRAKEMIIKARRELGERSESNLADIFGKPPTEAEILKDALMVDADDSEEGLSDG